MLAVTEVNGCRYCHSRIALSCGLSQSEVYTLSSGFLVSCPPEQVPALFFAQHWAESNANPDPQTRQGVLALYGKETMQTIELSLHMIRMGNLLGNSWDSILYRLSFRRRGVVEQDLAWGNWASPTQRSSSNTPVDFCIIPNHCYKISNWIEAFMIEF